MRAFLFLKTIAFLVALSLISFGVLDLTLGTLLKMIAGSFGIALLVAIFYPEIRGVKKGDKVIVTTGDMPGSFNIFLGKVGEALTPGRAKQQIRVKLGKGKEVVGIVEDCGGIITEPKVRVIYYEEEML
ncbi:MAG: hypothetical protein QW035_03265 [Candidatus Anstonellales archaeon]